MLSIFYTRESLFNALKAGNSNAYKALKRHVEKPIAQIGRDCSLSKADIQEFIQYCMVEQLEQIMDGRYTYQGFWVYSFTVEHIAKKRIYDFIRLLYGKSTVDIDRIDPNEADFERFETDHDIDDQCKSILARMCQKCQHLIRLTFQYGYCDAVIVEEKMTQYTDEEVLRKARSRCYEDFIGIAATKKVFTRKLEQLKAKKETKNNLKQLKKLQNGSAT
jgi:hypothetical protein